MDTAQNCSAGIAAEIMLLFSRGGSRSAATLKGLCQLMIFTQHGAKFFGGATLLRPTEFGVQANLATFIHLNKPQVGTSRTC